MLKRSGQTQRYTVCPFINDVLFQPFGKLAATRPKEEKTMKIVRIPLVIVLVVLAGRTFHANAQTETNLYSFVGPPTDGAEPHSGLVQGSDGSFYGTAYYGGTNGDLPGGAGTVFRISPSGNYTNLYFFGGYPNDGENPSAGLVQGSDGNFYGTTLGGGTTNFISYEGVYGYGTVFRISPGGTETTLYSFVGFPDGFGPSSGLVQGSDGNFYGTTEYGGAYGEGCCSGYGTVFRISASGSYTSLYSFGSHPSDGEYPSAGLVQGSDGNFYGTTSGTAGPSIDGGTVFRISPSGTETTLYALCGQIIYDCPNGMNPEGGLVQGSDGSFYGTTKNGGTNSYGTVFKITAVGTLTTLYTFSDGEDPTAGLLQGSDGSFYGTTPYGGTNGSGNVFRISPSGTYTSLYSFGGYYGDGNTPYAVLVQGSDGDFYGTTLYGGTNGIGNVFKLDVGLGPCGSASISPTNAVFGTAGGSNSVSVTASNICSWTAGSEDSFITITSGTNGTGNGTVYYSVAANTSTTPLTGTVFIADQVFTVTQAGLPCSASPTSTSANFGAAGGSSNVVVTANGTNCTWTASSNDSFITITSGSSGSGNGTAHYKVAANTSSNQQVGTMTIAGETFTVTESGTTSSSGSCSYALSPTSVTLTEKGGKKTVSVKTKGTDCDWTASTTNTWITITSGSSGTGSGKVEFSVPGNTNTTALSGAITIAGETYTVNQDAGGCTFKLSPKDGKLKAAGGTFTIKATPNLGDCEWTATTTNSFITITSGTSGTGKGSVTYTVPANTTTNVLTGTISVAGQAFTVTQSGVK